MMELDDDDAATSTDTRNNTSNSSSSPGPAALVDVPFPYWRVWRAANQLEQHGISSASSRTKEHYKITTLQVVCILRQWGHEWAGQQEWQSVLNKPSLLHEIEESIIALHHLHEWCSSSNGQPSLQPKQDQQQGRITVVDLCCGKGLFSMLLSYMIGIYWKNCGISRVVLLDKAIAIDWNHIDAANQNAEAENRPLLDLWRGVNLHDYDSLMDRFLNLKSTLALVGIHLCKMLSPASVSLVHGLGRKICPYFLLAPCCLPRVVTSRFLESDKRTIGIYQYETPTNRSKRRLAKARRDCALGRDRRGTCYLCHTTGHRVRNCSTLEGVCDPTRHQILQKASLQIPCWNCGQVGHFKANCPRKDSPSFLEPPMLHWNVASILTTSDPFSQYCQVLGKSLGEEFQVELVDVGLRSSKVQVHNKSQEGNWNHGRKSIYIVAMR